MDALLDLGPLALGSRLRRLSERLMADGTRLYRDQGLDFEPRWFPLFYLLGQQAPLSITDAARKLGVSHAAVSQTARELQRRRLVSSTRDPRDERRRRLALTQRAHDLLPRLVPIWNDFEAAAEELLAASERTLLTAIEDTEDALEVASLSDRIKARTRRRGQCEIVDFVPELRSHFERLNRAWLERFFELDELDRKVLGDPEGSLVQPGGAVFFARCDDQIVGTCGLQRLSAESFELVKLAVDEGAQGRGIGAHLVRTALRAAHARGALRVLIETSSRLEAANRLYTRFGFVADPTATREHERADTRLVLDLSNRWKRRDLAQLAPSR
jgi:DNA-binding MarR family transcriptional regulator